jgi:TonB-dependent starch-binding outer membrane protein SusC
MKRKITNLLLLLMFCNGTVFAQVTIVSGKVTDAKDGLPLPGVSVVVQEEPSSGVQTDGSGNYRINLPANARNLIFKYIGYKQQTLPVNSEVVNVVLEEDTKQLSEVVVVGYGTQIRENLTGSIAKVSAKDIEGTSRYSRLNLHFREKRLALLFPRAPVK